MSSDHEIITQIKSQVDRQGEQIGSQGDMIRTLVEGQNELTRNVNTLVQTVERNTSSNQHLGEKVDKVVAKVEDDIEPRLRDIEKSQAGNKVRWAITATISGAIMCGLISLGFFVVRPLFVIDSASDQNSAMIERLTTIVERLESNDE